MSKFNDELFETSLSSCSHTKVLRQVYKSWDFELSDGKVLTQSLIDSYVKTFIASSSNTSVSTFPGKTQIDFFRSITTLMKNVISPQGGWQQYFYGNNINGTQPVVILSLSKKLIGKKIHPTSLQITHSGVTLNDNPVYERDNVYDIGVLKNGSTNVGFVLYEFGLVCITSNDLISTHPNLGINSTYVNFKSTKEVFINEVFVDIPIGKYSYTTNPTYFVSSSNNEIVQVPFEVYLSGSPDNPYIKKNYIRNKKGNNIDIIDDGTRLYWKEGFLGTVSGSIHLRNPVNPYPQLYLYEKDNPFLTTDILVKAEMNVPLNNAVNKNRLKFITNIGLYNDKKELIAVAKPANPIPLYEDVDLNFNIKFDTDA